MTGYTGALVERDQTFEEFVWSCARAFGALVLMRDDASDAPIPETFKPDDYHAKKAKDAEAELSRINRLDERGRLAMGEKLKMESVGWRREAIARGERETAKLAEILARVKAWTPPSPDHVRLKEFMVQQLESSLPDLGWDRQALADAEAQTSLDYFNARVLSLQKDPHYHREQLAEEVARVNGRNKWLADLRQSIPLPASMRQHN